MKSFIVNLIVTHMLSSSFGASGVTLPQCPATSLRRRRRAAKPSNLEHWRRQGWCARATGWALEEGKSPSRGEQARRQALSERDFSAEFLSPRGGHIGRPEVPRVLEGG